MEAKAEQAGNLVHDRNDREAFRLVGELSGNKSGGHLQAVSEGGRIFCGTELWVGGRVEGTSAGFGFWGFWGTITFPGFGFRVLGLWGYIGALGVHWLHPPLCHPSL